VLLLKLKQKPNSQTAPFKIKEYFLPTKEILALISLSMFFLALKHGRLKENKFYSSKSEV